MDFFRFTNVNEGQMGRKMLEDDKYSRVGRDQFFGTRPRPRNQTYRKSLRDRDQEIKDAKFLYETRPKRDCLIFLDPR